MFAAVSLSEHHGDQDFLAGNTNIVASIRVRRIAHTIRSFMEVEAWNPELQRK